jgi:hypothetical protein
VSNIHTLLHSIGNPPITTNYNTIATKYRQKIEATPGIHPLTDTVRDERRGGGGGYMPSERVRRTQSPHPYPTPTYTHLPTHSHLISSHPTPYLESNTHRPGTRQHAPPPHTNIPRTDLHAPEQIHMRTHRGLRFPQTAPTLHRNFNAHVCLLRQDQRRRDALCLVLARRRRGLGRHRV